jgi:Skp family chaperone for outer membrane proteins
LVAASPSAAPSLTGPLIAGVCLLSQEDLIERSRVGQAATGRLRVLTQDVQTALEAEKARLERKGNALGAQRAALPPAQFQAQAMALNQRGQALQSEAGERSRQVDATRAKALNRILQEAQPLIAQAFTAHGCGLLISRNAVLAGNLGNDLTPEVIVALDAKVAPLTFDLEPPTTPAAK